MHVCCCVQYVSTSLALKPLTFEDHIRACLQHVQHELTMCCTCLSLYAVHVHIPSPEAPHIWGPHQSLSPASIWINYVLCLYAVHVHIAGPEAPHIREPYQSLSPACTTYINKVQCTFVVCSTCPHPWPRSLPHLRPILEPVFNMHNMN